MKCFVVLSCIVAVACGLSSYPVPGGGFGGSSYGGYSAQEHQQSHHESHQSRSSQVSSAGGLVGGGAGLLGGGGLVDSYGAGGYDSHSLAASSLASRSTLAAAESGLSTGYGSGLGLHESAALSGSGLGIGAGGLGGYNSYNGGQSFHRQSSVSRQSFSQSSSSHSLINYQQEWPELYQVPLFQSLCGLKSTLKSQEFASTFAQQSYDYGSVFSDLYQRNALLQKYFSVATGIRYQESYRSNYFQMIGQNPYQALRLATIFARNPNVFTSPFGQFIIGGSSLELLQGYQSYSTSRYSYDAFSSSRFLNSLVRSKYYSRSLASIFGIQQNLSYELLQQQLLNRISGYYRSNAAGTLLLLRHVIARRQISSLDAYLGCTGADVYSSQLNSYWAQKSWRHNSYYSNWSRQFSRSSSFSSRSSRAVSRSSISSGSLGYNGIGI